MIKVSIITITMNHLSGLIKTFKSVTSQTCKEFEFIVIDGASRDGTPDFLKGHSKEIDFYLSEPDTGIYNAMNKGIAHSNGEYLIFMNAGDIFADQEVLADMSVFLDGKYPMVFGESVNPDGMVHAAIQSVKLSQFWGISFPHQAAFIARDLFQKYGGYREEYRCASDIFFFYEMVFREKIPYLVTDRNVCLYEGGGLSAGTIGRREWHHYVMHHMGLHDKIYCLLLELYSALKRNRGGRG